MKDQALDNSIVTLYNKGWSERRLSREFRISRGRVKRILERNANQRQNGNDQLKKPLRRASKLDAYKTYISKLLEKYKEPPITNQRIFELLQEKGFNGKITIVRDYLAGLRGKQPVEPIVCVETSPGQRASHDWSEYYIEFTDTARVEKVTFFSIILAYSRRQYIEIVEDKTQLTLLNALINAFVYFDGVPREIKSDNQKACVDRWEFGRPVFNHTFLNFATYYRFRPLAITPGKPRENLKVERPFYYLETNFLNGRKFRDKQDLNQQLRHWLKEKNDRRLHRITGQKPVERYKEELAFLQPLPVKHYDTSVIEYRIVNHESAISWKGYYYMVPSEYMHETCTVRANNEQIVIYGPDNKEIVSYKPAEKGRKDRYVGKVTKTKKYTQNAKDIIERLNAYGPVMQKYTEYIKSHRPTTYLHHFRRILTLKANYTDSDIIAAVNRALKHHVYDSKAIENFLKINARKKSELNFSSKNYPNE